LPGVSLGDVRVRQPALGGEFGSEHDVGGVDVQGGHPAARPDPLRQQVDNATGAPAQIDRAPPFRDANPVQQLGAAALKFLGLAPQPVSLGRAATERVDRSAQRC